MAIHIVRKIENLFVSTYKWENSAKDEKYGTSAIGGIYYDFCSHIQAQPITAHNCHRSPNGIDTESMVDVVMAMTVGEMTRLRC